MNVRKTLSRADKPMCQIFTMYKGQGHFQLKRTLAEKATVLSEHFSLKKVKCP